jgi:rhodanese-related sulfurtransferase
MNIVRTFSVVAIMVFSIGHANAQSSKLLNVNEFEKKLVATKHATVLDVRTQAEYNQGHLSGAMLMDYYKSDFKQQAAKLDKNKPVFVYCKAGGRSESAVEILTDLGFKQVYDLQGGITSWSKAGKPTEK